MRRVTCADQMNPVFPIFTPMSGTVRQQKFSRLIQKELSDIFQRDQRGVLGNAFITIVDVRVSPDLSLARVYISMMLAPDKKVVLEKLDSHKKEIRKALGDRIRNQARIIPELAFFIDEVEENAKRMDDLLKGLHIPPADPAIE
jgi:ribosome-binding factor A